MRQAGVLAAAGLHALDHHSQRLADDHARARRLAERSRTPCPAPSTRHVETNIVVLPTADGAGVGRAARPRERACCSASSARAPSASSPTSASTTTVWSTGAEVLARLLAG